MIGLIQRQQAKQGSLGRSDPMLWMDACDAVGGSQEKMSKERRSPAPVFVEREAPTSPLRPRLAVNGKRSNTAQRAAAAAAAAAFRVCCSFCFDGSRFAHMCLHPYAALGACSTLRPPSRLPATVAAEGKP